MYKDQSTKLYNRRRNVVATLHEYKKVDRIEIITIISITFTSLKWYLRKGILTDVLIWLSIVNFIIIHFVLRRFTRQRYSFYFKYFINLE